MEGERRGWSLQNICGNGMVTLNIRHSTLSISLLFPFLFLLFPLPSHSDSLERLPPVMDWGPYDSCVLHYALFIVRGPMRLYCVWRRPLE